MDDIRRSLLEARTLLDTARHYIGTLEAENAALKQGNLAAHASVFWDTSEPGALHDSVGEAMDAYSFGEIVEIGRAVVLPSLYAVRVPIDDGDEIEQFDDLETAKSFVAEMWSPPDAA